MSPLRQDPAESFHRRWHVKISFKALDYSSERVWILIRLAFVSLFFFFISTLEPHAPTHHWPFTQGAELWDYSHASRSRLVVLVDEGKGAEGASRQSVKG